MLCHNSFVLFAKENAKAGSKRLTDISALAWNKEMLFQKMLRT